MVEPFSAFMQRALYAPQVGYYAKRRPIGREGDFFTSVSVGSCFGGLVAAYVAQQWTTQGRPAAFSLVEQGANNGALANDVLHALEIVHPACFAAVSYHILEPLGDLVAWQRDTLGKFAEHVTWHPPSSPPVFPHGVFIANELLDAFPVELVRWQGGAWHRLGADQDYQLTTLPLPQSLEEAIAQFPEPNYPEGYQTEVMLGLEEWWASTGQLFSQSGAWLLMDYGLPQEEYYALQRHQGTLRGYRNHQMLGNFPEGFVFGETDLTTHVNWTQVAALATNHGLLVKPPLPQSRFLTPLAMPQLLAMDGQSPEPSAAKWLRQFQTLTHPSQLGEKFQVMEVLLTSKTNVV